VVLAVFVTAKAGVSEGVFSFGGVDESRRRPIETDRLSSDDLSVGGFLDEDLIGKVVSRGSQDTTV